MKILHREYGDHVRIVGICDGTASAEDPAGLNMAELLRLVHASLPLDQFHPSKLGPKTTFMKTDTYEGVRLRNTMHNRSFQYKLQV